MRLRLCFASFSVGCGVVFLLFSGCMAPRTSRTTERDDFRKYYEERGVEGAFVLYDLNSDRFSVFNPDRIETPFIPASTFKIFNSLVALETGVVSDADEVIAWDGVDRGLDPWNRDHSMRSAIRVSAVWFYQELARRIGADRMQLFIDRTEYGNLDIGGGIDQFWLSGDLRISAREQIEFLVRLYHGDLPFSDRSVEMVRDILVLEKTDDFVLRGKTGWANAFSPNVGWFVGYVERGDDVFFFANNVAIVEENDHFAREAIARRILGDMGLITNERNP